MRSFFFCYTTRHFETYLISFSLSLSLSLSFSLFFMCPVISKHDCANLKCNQLADKLLDLNIDHFTYPCDERSAVPSSFELMSFKILLQRFAYVYTQLIHFPFTSFPKNITIIVLFLTLIKGYLICIFNELCLYLRHLTVTYTQHSTITLTTKKPHTRQNILQFICNKGLRTRINFLSVFYFANCFKQSQWKWKWVYPTDIVPLIKDSYASVSPLPVRM